MDGIDLPYGMQPEQLIDLHEAIVKLELESAEKAKVVQLRFFVGMTHEEVAEVLGVSAVTVRRHWRYARAWLRRELNFEMDKEASEELD